MIEIPDLVLRFRHLSHEVLANTEASLALMQRQRESVINGSALNVAVVDHCVEILSGSHESLRAMNETIQQWLDIHDRNEAAGSTQSNAAIEVSSLLGGNTGSDQSQSQAANQSQNGQHAGDEGEPGDGEYE